MNLRHNIPHRRGDKLKTQVINASLAGIIELLVAFGADVNSVDKSGLTSFQTAIMQENKALSDFLLSKGVKQQST